MVPDRFVMNGTHQGRFHEDAAGSYPGRIELYDIGEDDYVGVFYTADRSRQVQPIEWHKQARELLSAHRRRMRRPRIEVQHNTQQHSLPQQQRHQRMRLHP